MKKTLTILSAALVLLISISFNAKAQDDRPTAKSYIAFLGGLSLASGDFGKSDYNNNSAGFAKNGATFGLDGAYYIHRNFGIGVTFSFQDQGELSTNDAQTLSDGYNASFQRDQTTVTAVNRYHSYNFMGGPQYSFIRNKFTIDLRASAGIIKSTSTPDITTILDPSSIINSLTLEQKSSTGITFAYGGSAGLRYNFSDSWDIGFKANYVTSSGINISNTGQPTPNPGRLVTKQPISELQTTFGITLHL
jgi:hypothetical protein